MFYILTQEKGNNIFYLHKNQEYVVGRKNTDVVLSDDQSISRKHAVISTKGNCVTLTDCKSKYGTFCNNKQLKENEVSLKEQDIIKFGIFQSVYKFEKYNVITTGSGLTDAQKKHLTNTLTSIGGLFVNNWDNSCTFLTAQEIILTIKVLLALIDDKPIVNLKFWDEFVSNIQNNKPLPDPNNFKPPINETLLNQDISYNPTRRGLFRDKTFVFTSDKVRKKMGELIGKTGGTTLSWEKRQLSITDLKKSKKEYIFINDDSDSIPPSLGEIHNYLEEIGQRTIPIQEIAMAVVYCSCEKDCNPNFNRIHKVFKTVPDSKSQVFALAPNTQSQDIKLETKIENDIVIPPSLEPDLNMIVPIKAEKNRLVEKEDPPPKRFKFSPKSAQKTAAPSESPPASGSSSSQSQSIGNSSRPSAFLSRKRQAEDDSTSPRKTPKRSDAAAFFNTTHESTRKKTALANPFAFIRKEREPDSQENPFVAHRVKEERYSDVVTNPFSRVSCTPKTEKREAELKIESQNEATCIVPIVWLSKTMEKDSFSVSENSVELDPDMQKIYDMFQDTVVIEKIPTSTFRVFTPYSLTQESNSSKKNFKKFKKVLPKRPQTTVLVTSVQDPIEMGSDGEENPDDEEEIEIVRKPNQKTKHQNFAL